MIDDSLSDTQQEKKQMSVKELVLNGNTSTLIVKEIGKELMLVRITPESTTLLDRSQSHLLMLYLQEHLGYVSISKDRLND